MNNNAGKGPELRKGSDLNKYWTNFPVLSSTEIKFKKKIKLKNGKVRYIYQ